MARTELEQAGGGMSIEGIDITGESGMSLDGIDITGQGGMSLEGIDITGGLGVATEASGPGLLPGAKRAPDGSQYMPSMIEGAIPEVLGSKQLGALGLSIGHGMQWAVRGVKQFLGLDEETMKKEEMIMDDLFENKRYGATAKTGDIVGSFVEPVGLLLPGAVGAKAAVALTKSQAAVRAAVAASKGVAVGATYGGLGYVREDKGETRLGNMAIGGTLGGVLAGGTSLVRDVVHSGAIKKATDLVADTEKNFATKIIEGKAPDVAMKEMKAEMPKLAKDLTKAAELAGRKPKLPLNEAQARATIDFYKGTHMRTERNEFLKQADDFLGVMSTRLKEQDESYWGRLMQHDANVSVKSQAYLEKVDPFINSYKSTFSVLKRAANPQLDDVRKGMHTAWLNNDRGTLTSLVKTHMGDAAVKQLDEVYKVTQEVGDNLVATGILKQKDLIPDYLPRFLVDKKGFFNEIGKDVATKIEQDLAKANTTAISKMSRPLTAQEESIIIDKSLRGFPKLGFKPTLAHERTMNTVPPKFAKYYAEPEEAIHTHINEAVANIEKWAFLGRDNIVKQKEGKLDVLNTAESIGSLVRKQVEAGNLDPLQEKEITAILNARFGLGERSPMGWLQDAKSITTSVLLANPISAAAQLGDIGATIAINGWMPTLKATAQVLTGRHKITAKEMGLVNRITEEFVSTRSISKFLNGAMKWSGFSTVDRTMKAINMNATLMRLQKQATTNPTAFRAEYMKAFGAQADDMLLALQSGKITGDVKTLIWSKLTDTQVISKSEVPLRYLNHPDGRWMYTFKSFAIKQLDYERRIANETIRKGQVAKGLAQMTKFGIYLGAAGATTAMIRDFMSGRDAEDIIKDASWDDIPVNMFKTFGYNEIVQKDLKAGRPMQAAFDIAAPPYKLLDKFIPIRYGEEGLELRADSPQEAAWDMMQHAPPYGKWLYMWFGGGLEKLEEQRAKQNEQ